MVFTTLLTGVVDAFVRLAVEWQYVRRAAEFSQSVVGDLEHPATVNDAVRRLQMSVTVDWTVVQIDHPLRRYAVR